MTIRTISVLHVDQHGTSWRWRVGCPNNRQPREWQKDEVELFVAAMCLCVPGKPEQTAKLLVDSSALWTIALIEGADYSLVVNHDGREWSTREPLRLAAAVRAFKSDSDGTGGELQLTAHLLKGAASLEIHLSNN